MGIFHEVSLIDMKFEKTTWQQGLLPFHWHEKFEIIIPIDNCFGVSIDGEFYDVKAGDIIMIGAQAIHCFHIYENDTNVILGQFPYRILLDDSVMPTAVKPFISAEEIEKDEVFSKQLKCLFEIMIQERTVMEGEKNPFLQSVYSALYFLLMRKFSFTDKSKIEKSEKRVFYEIVNYVNENYSENITVQSVASSLFIDRSRISKIFSKYSGMNLNYYINFLRVKKAVQLIDKGEKTTKAAMESGFQSVRTFNNFYKKIKDI